MRSGSRALTLIRRIVITLDDRLRPGSTPLSLRRAAVWIPLAIAAALAPTPASADEIRLADSTSVESFRLANGLRVVMRNVPLSGQAALCLAYPSGSWSDPAAREGLQLVLAKLHYFSGAADSPRRTAADMDRLRPAGWDLVVNPRVTRECEVATLGQLPGVVRQMASRLRGVQFDESELHAAIESARADQTANLEGDIVRMVSYRTRAIAEGADDKAIHARATLAGLQSLPLKEARERIAQRFVPANAVLSIAGDLRAFPMRKLIEQEFGGIPSGTAAAPAARRPLAKGRRIVTAPSLARPVMAIGLVAPAIEDSLHAYFYASVLAYGVLAPNEWGPPEDPIGSRFRFALLEDPDLALFFPPVPTEGDVMMQALESYAIGLRTLAGTTLPEGTTERLVNGTDWLLGGPVPSDLLPKLRGSGSGLITLASAAATRELWGGDAFWSRYRQRLRLALSMHHASALDLVLSAERRVEVLFTPAPPAK
jgi:hypothetical protein